MKYNSAMDIVLDMKKEINYDNISVSYALKDDPYIVLFGGYYLEKEKALYSISPVIASVSNCENAKPMNFKRLAGKMPCRITKRSRGRLHKEILKAKILDKSLLYYELENIIPVKIKGIEKDMAVIEFICEKL